MDKNVPLPGAGPRDAAAGRLVRRSLVMEKKNIDWGNLGFGYIATDKRYVSNYKDGAWDEGVLTDDANGVISECAGVRQ